MIWIPKLPFLKTERKRLNAISSRHIVEKSRRQQEINLEEEGSYHSPPHAQKYSTIPALSSLG